MAYKASPMTAEMSLQIEEVDDLLTDDVRSLRDQRALRHFVRRVHLTIQSYRDQIKSLNTTLQEMKLSTERVGQPTTLDPRDAVRFLAVDQLTELVDGHMRERMHAVERMQSETSRKAKQVNRDHARIQLAVASVLEDPDLPEPVRRKFAEKFAQDPGTSEAATVVETTRPDGALGELFS